MDLKYVRMNRDNGDGEALARRAVNRYHVANYVRAAHDGVRSLNHPSPTGGDSGRDITLRIAATAPPATPSARSKSRAATELSDNPAAVCRCNETVLEPGGN